MTEHDRKWPNMNKWQNSIEQQWAKDFLKVLHSGEAQTWATGQALNLIGHWKMPKMVL